MNFHEQLMEKCSRHFKHTVAGAFRLASSHGSTMVTPIHLLLALAAENGSIAEEILMRSRLKRDELTRIATKIETIALDTKATLSPNAKRAIEKAFIRAAQGGHIFVGTEHLLFGLIEIASSDIEQCLERCGAKKKDIAQQIEVAMKSASKLPEMLSDIWNASTKEKTRDAKKSSRTKQKIPALEYFGVELTATEYSRSLDPIVGRDAEIERLVHVLLRRTKNNPLLLGDPGVGKTALVEGLAQRIVSGIVPGELLDKRIFSLDIGLMIAGTMYRGEFESRVKQIIQETQKNPDIILFIDEVHNLVGAGSSSGNLDAANMLKPALARGELHVIGATTHEEFKKHIEHDAALERRFQPIIVREPTADETIAMLEAVKKQYETFHNVSVGSEAIRAATQLSDKFFPEKRYPDKALDLLDEAMSAVKLAAANHTFFHQMNDLKRALSETAQLKEKAVMAEDYEAAQKLKAHETHLDELLDEMEKHSHIRGDALPTLTTRDIEHVVERIVGKTLESKTKNNNGIHPRLADALSNTIFGQDEIIRTVAHAITKAELGLHADNRPIASFLFAGPSGVGKTELAKQITEHVYNDSQALIRIDMTEFSEGYSVSKLLGSPAGYVGYRESSTLVDRLRRRPLSVLLFDEIEKAHPDVLNVLLQMLEEGRLTDASGKSVSVKQTIIILTVNVPIEQYSGATLGFTNTEAHANCDAIRASLFQTLKPELLNRIDHICVFEPLSQDALRAIARSLLNDLSSRVERKFFEFTWEKNTPDTLAAMAQNPREGARAVRKLFDTHIEQPLVNAVAEHPEFHAYRAEIKNGILEVVPTYGRPSETEPKTISRRARRRAPNASIAAAD